MMILVRLFPLVSQKVVKRPEREDFFDLLNWKEGVQKTEDRSWKLEIFFGLLNGKREVGKEKMEDRSLESEVLTLPEIA